MGILQSRPLFSDLPRSKVNEVNGEIGQEKRKIKRTVLKTDAGGMVENTKAYERTILKELGKMTL